jgi:hypothetical protein
VVEAWLGQTRRAALLGQVRTGGNPLAAACLQPSHGVPRGLGRAFRDSMAMAQVLLTHKHPSRLSVWGVGGPAPYFSLLLSIAQKLSGLHS